MLSRTLLDLDHYVYDSGIFGDIMRRIKIYMVIMIVCNQVSYLAFVLTRLILCSNLGRRVRVIIPRTNLISRETSPHVKYRQRLYSSHEVLTNRHTVCGCPVLSRTRFLMQEKSFPLLRRYLM